DVPFQGAALPRGFEGHVDIDATPLAQSLPRRQHEPAIGKQPPVRAQELARRRKAHAQRLRFGQFALLLVTSSSTPHPIFLQISGSVAVSARLRRGSCLLSGAMWLDLST